MSLQGGGATALSNYIKNTLLPTVTSIRSANIFDNELTDLAGFPAAVVTMRLLSGETLDNSRNKRTFEFTIRIFIDRNPKNFGTQQAESILRTLTNDLITAVDADYTLGGNCIFCKPFVGEMGYADRENINLRVMTVILSCIDANTWR